MSLDHEKSSGHVGTEKGRGGDDGASYVDGPADIFAEGTLDPIYQAKARILNEALQEIGMGKYQVRYPLALLLARSHARPSVVLVRRRRFWLVRVSSSCGSASNSALTFLPVETISGRFAYLSSSYQHLSRKLTVPHPFQIVTGLILAPVVQEFSFKGPFLKLAQNIGLLVGAAFWGLASDVWGRRFVPSFIPTHVFAHLSSNQQLVLQPYPPHHRHIRYRGRRLSELYHPLCHGRALVGWRRWQFARRLRRLPRFVTVVTWVCPVRTNLSG